LRAADAARRSTADDRRLAAAQARQGHRRRAGAGRAVPGGRAVTDQSKRVEQLAAALIEHVRQPGEKGRARAYELGRAAQGSGVGLVEMVAVLHGALTAAAAELRSSVAEPAMLAASQEFWIECLSAFEIVYRSSAEANAALREASERLERETRRIAQSLHAESWQLLAAVHPQLAPLRSTFPKPPEPLPRVQGPRE